MPALPNYLGRESSPFRWEVVRKLVRAPHIDAMMIGGGIFGIIPVLGGVSTLSNGLGLSVTDPAQVRSSIWIVAISATTWLGCRLLCHYKMPSEIREHDSREKYLDIQSNLNRNEPAEVLQGVLAEANIRWNNALEMVDYYSATALTAGLLAVIALIVAATNIVFPVSRLLVLIGS